MEGDYIEFATEAIVLLLKISMPLLLAGLVVGLLISLFQALTQIQEPTLSFVPKIIAILLTLLMSLSFIGASMSKFSEDVMSRIVNIE